MSKYSAVTVPAVVHVSVSISPNGIGVVAGTTVTPPLSPETNAMLSVEGFGRHNCALTGLSTMTPMLSLSIKHSPAPLAAVGVPQFPKSLAVPTPVKPRFTTQSSETIFLEVQYKTPKALSQISLKTYRTIHALGQNILSMIRSNLEKSLKMNM